MPALERCLELCRTSEIVVLKLFADATLGATYALAGGAVRISGTDMR